MDRRDWGKARSGQGSGTGSSPSTADRAASGSGGASGGRFRFASRDRRRSGARGNGPSTPRTQGQGGRDGASARSPSPGHRSGGGGQGKTRDRGRAAPNWRSPDRAATGGSTDAGASSTPRGGVASAPGGAARRWGTRGSDGRGVGESSGAAGGRVRLSASVRHKDRAAWLAQLALLQPSARSGWRGGGGGGAGSDSTVGRDVVLEVLRTVSKVLFPSASITRHDSADMVTALCAASPAGDADVGAQVFRLVVSLSRHIQVCGYLGAGSCGARHSSRALASRASLAASQLSFKPQQLDVVVPYHCAFLLGSGSGSGGSSAEATRVCLKALSFVIFENADRCTKV